VPLDAAPARQAKCPLRKRGERTVIKSFGNLEIVFGRLCWSYNAAFARKPRHYDRIDGDYYAAHD
jgi:hypothetical protein